MNAWLTVGLLQTVFVALVFARRARAGAASVWLFAWLAVAFAHQLSIYASFAHPEAAPRALAIGLGLLAFLHGPLAFGYVAAFLPAGALSRTAPLHLAPFFLIWGVALFIDAATPGVVVDPTLGVTTFEDAAGAVIGWPSWMMALSGGFYPLVSLVLLRRARPELLASRSDYSAVNFRWLHVWVFGHIVAFAAIFAAQLIFSTRTAMPMASWVLAAEVFYLGAFGVWGVETGARARPGARAPRIEKASVEQDAARLTDFMAKAGLYRKPGLTLLELSEASGLSQPTITSAVKHAGYKHFFDFVNSFRCEEVKARLDRDPPTGETLLSIAYEAGFNSKSAFNRVFKHHVGVSPSAYRNRRPTS